MIFEPFFIHCQLRVPVVFDPEAPRLKRAPWQMVADPEMVIPICCVWVTPMVIALEVAVVGVAQAALLVSWQLTCCPLVRVLVVQVEALAPDTAVPLSIH